jgi:uncharacterized iron-regulated protein
MAHMLAALLIVTGSWAADCSRISPRDIGRIDPPAVVVLGERRGTPSDLWRAKQLVRKLSRRATTTLALEAAHHARQPAIDRYEQGLTGFEDLAIELAWSDYWDFPITPDRPLLVSAQRGVAVRAIGVDRSPKPTDYPVPIPPGYLFVLEDAFGSAPPPVIQEDRLILAIAYRDHRLAKGALEAWDGKGYLVLIADRFHVEGGKGISWQLERMSPAPVHAVLLSDAGAACHPADKILR